MRAFSLTRVALAAAALLLTVTTTVHAQMAEQANSRVAGWSGSIIGAGVSRKIDVQDDMKYGGSAGVQGLYGFANNISAGLRFQGGLMGDSFQSQAGNAEKGTFLQVDAVGRYSFGQHSTKLRPFVEATVGRHGASQKVAGVTFENDAYVYGGAVGAAYFLRPNIAIEGAAAAITGKFDDINTRVTQGQLRFGVVAFRK